MLSSKPIIPQTIERWFSEPTQASILRELLENPFFEAAVATLLSAARPTFLALTDTERNAQRQAWLAGYHDFANDLLKLTKAPLTKGKNLEEWSHYD
jgi:hypothetical protein